MEWLRFLVCEVLAPQAREPRERMRRFGLPGGHRVDGELVLEGVLRPKLLVAAGRRVRVVVLDEDLSPPEPQRRVRGEVVRLDSSRDQSTER